MGRGCRVSKLPEQSDFFIEPEKEEAPPNQRSLRHPASPVPAPWSPWRASWGRWASWYRDSRKRSAGPWPGSCRHKAAGDILLRCGAFPRRNDQEAGEKNRSGNARRVARARRSRTARNRPARQPNRRACICGQDPRVSCALHADVGSPDDSPALRPDPLHGRGSGGGPLRSRPIGTRVVSRRRRAKPAQAAPPCVRRLRPVTDPGVARFERCRRVVGEGSLDGSSEAIQNRDAAQSSSVGRTATPCFSRNRLHSEILYSP